MSFRLLLVEDDRTLRTALRDAFAGEGYAVEVAADGHEARATLREQRFDLVVLDVMLPGPSGLELLRELRARDADTPVLLLTARGEEGDKVLGLELGADDYVSKPFSLRELLARVKAMLRRRERTQAAGVQQFSLGEARIDLAAFTAVRDGVTHTLSPKEAGMLSLLRQHGGRAVSRAAFLRDVWGGDQFVGDRTIDTHMLNLRQKVEADPKQPRYLLTVHGIGYRLVEEPEAGGGPA
ncbi:MAG TPA: response regulator transcription factor [Planctomycetota bacterium]|nr:response regulator transcription factor [Planctomycetota bacterium]